MIFESDERDTSIWPMTFAVAGSILMHAGLFIAWAGQSPVQAERLSPQAIEVTLVSATAPPEQPAPPTMTDAGQQEPQAATDLVATAPAPGPADAARLSPPAPALEESVALAEVPPALSPRELTAAQSAAEARSADLLDRVQAPPPSQPRRQAPPAPELPQRRPVAPSRLSDSGSQASEQQARQDYVLQVVRKLSHRQFYARGDRSSASGGVVVARLTVGRDGALVDLALAKDSGSTGLDGSVLDAIRKAAPFAPLPQAFAQNTFTFIVPINYAQER